MNIHGPKGTIDFIKDIKSAFKEDIKIRVAPPENHSEEGLKTKTYEIQQGLVFEKNQLKVIAFDVDHGGGVKHAYGYKIIYKGVITDLKHSRRILINDFALTNPYPSSIAINTERNSEELSGIFENLR